MYNSRKPKAGGHHADLYGYQRRQFTTQTLTGVRQFMKGYHTSVLLERILAYPLSLYPVYGQVDWVQMDMANIPTWCLLLLALSKQQNPPSPLLETEGMGPEL